MNIMGLLTSPSPIIRFFELFFKLQFSIELISFLRFDSWLSLSRAALSSFLLISSNLLIGLLLKTKSGSMISVNS